MSLGSDCGRTRGGRFARIAIVLAAMLGSSVARADPSEAELEQARETYRAALALETAGDWAGALAKIRDVGAVKLTPQVRFHTARCQDKLGRWTEAVGTYRLAIAEAESAGIEDVVREASAALAALEPVVPRLRIQRGAGAAGATIALDGVSLGETSIGAELSVDPGPHRVDVAFGARRATTTVTLAAREHRILTTELPREDVGSDAPPSHAAVSPDRAREPARWPAFAMLGVGVAGLATAGVFWGLRAGTVSDLEDECVGGHCPPSLEPTSDRGKVFTFVSAGGLAVGVLGLGAFTWLMLRDRPTSPGRADRAGLAVGVGDRRVSVRGLF